jgi:hypothetical protein
MLLVREAGGWTSDFLADDGLVKGNPIVVCTPEIVSRVCSAGHGATGDVGRGLGGVQDIDGLMANRAPIARAGSEEPYLGGPGGPTAK